MSCTRRALCWAERQTVNINANGQTRNLFTTRNVLSYRYEFSKCNDKWKFFVICKKPRPCGYFPPVCYFAQNISISLGRPVYPQVDAFCLSKNESFLNIRSRNHARFFPSEYPVPVPGNKIINEVADKTGDYNESVKQLPCTAHIL